jgi:hypothetical protein
MGAQGSIRTEASNWQPWLLFFLRALAEQMKRLHRPQYAEAAFQGFGGAGAAGTTPGGRRVWYRLR